MSIAHGLSTFRTCVAAKTTSGEAAAYALKHVTLHELAHPPDVGSKLPCRARMNVDNALRVLEIEPYVVHVEGTEYFANAGCIGTREQPGDVTVALGGNRRRDRE